MTATLPAELLAPLVRQGKPGEGRLSKSAKRVRSAGRWDDTVLVHIDPEELEALAAQFGPPTINPDTGLHEFGFLKFLKKVAPFAVSLIPGAGPAIGSALGLTGTAASVAGGALLGAGTGAITGGGKGAVLGGLTGGALGGAGGLSSALGQEAGSLGAGLVSAGLGAGAGALSAGITGGDVGKGALMGGAAGGLQGLINATQPGGALGEPLGAGTPGAAPMAPGSPATTAGTATGGGTAQQTAAQIGGLTDLTAPQIGTTPGFWSGLENGVATPPSPVTPTPAATYSAAPTAGAIAADTSTGGFWGGVKDTLTSPAAVIGALGLGYQALANPTDGQVPAPELTDNLVGTADNLNSQSQQLMSYINSGYLPPGAMARINAATQAAKASVRSSFASMGLSGSSSEASALGEIDVRAAGQIFEQASSLLQTGMQQARISADIYRSLLNDTRAEDDEMDDAITNFAMAIAGGGERKAA